MNAPVDPSDVAEPRSLNARLVALEKLPLDPETVLAGAPRASAAGLYRFGDTEIGLWELTTGKVTDVEVDEVFVVLSGSGRVDFGSGESVDLAPGTVVRLYAGDTTTWTITESLRKLWISR